MCLKLEQELIIKIVQSGFHDRLFSVDIPLFKTTDQDCIVCLIMFIELIPFFCLDTEFPLRDATSFIYSIRGLELVSHLRKLNLPD